MFKSYGSKYLANLLGTIEAMEARPNWSLLEEQIYNGLVDTPFQIALVEQMLEQVEMEDGPLAEWDDYELARLGLLAWEAITRYLQGCGSLEEIAEREREVEIQQDVMNIRCE